MGARWLRRNPKGTDSGEAGRVVLKPGDRVTITYGGPNRYRTGVLLYFVPAHTPAWDLWPAGLQKPAPTRAPLGGGAPEDKWVIKLDNPKFTWYVSYAPRWLRKAGDTP